MTKKDLIKIGSDATGFTHKSVERILDEMLAGIAGALASDETVYIQEFGRFIPWECKAKKGRNAKTGETIEIPARKKVKFKYYGKV